MDIDSVWDCSKQTTFFFPGGDPANQESFVKRAEYLNDRIFDRANLVRILKREHERLGAGQKTLDNIDLLAKPETLAIVTGQQIGILTGPLYTLYKGITAIKLAEEQSELLNRPVVPIFWLAGEDHDWAEIQTTWILDGTGKPAPCQIPGHGKGLSVGLLPVPPWEKIEEQLNGILPHSEFKAEIMGQLEILTKKAENLSDWFVLIFQWLLKDRGMIFFNPLLPEFKHMAVDCYNQILNSHHQINEAFKKRTQALIEEGYEPQIKLTGNEVNLFLAIPERRAILWDERGYYLRGKEEFYQHHTLSERLLKSPENFSPNVVTRPVVQEFLLPTLAYIPGPGEMSYWAQLGGVFTCLGYKMPVLYPRLSLVVITAHWHKILENEGLTLEQVYEGLGEHREKRLIALDNLNIEERFAHLRSSIDLAYENLIPLYSVHPQGEDWIKQNREKVESQIQYLEKKIWQAHRKQCEGLIKHLNLLEDGLFPKGKHQERIYNPISFLVRYGFYFIEKVFEMPLIPRFKEQQLVLE